MTVVEAIGRRRSVREYSDRPIPAGTMERLIESLRMAPSACNNQPWKFILIRNPENRMKVAAICRDQKWMAGAPLIVAACGIPEAAYKKMGGYGNSVDIDLAIAMDHLTLVAAEEGLGTCWIGAFNEQALKEHLGVPANVKIVVLTPVGYPAGQIDLAQPPDKKRRPRADIFSDEKWSASN